MNKKKRLQWHPEDKDEINHRIIFDVTDDSDYKIVKLGPRPDFYDLENLEEAEQRI